MNDLINRDFWQGKKVLLSGHTGFKGSWLALWLSEMGAEVSGVALKPASTPNLFELLKLDQRINSYIGDVREIKFVQTVFEKTEPEIIFHLAAQALVRHSYRDPVETYSTNVLGTLSMLEAARRASSVKVFINVTSDKCYENQEWHWGYRENDVLGGYDPYSSSKACAELLTSAYRRSFFSAKENDNKPGLASVRAGNVIGGGDWAEDRLIPDIIREFVNNKAVCIRNPNAIRPWQHVLEPLSGYMLLAQLIFNQPKVYAQAWNFGPADRDARTVGWVAEKVRKYWGSGQIDIVKQGNNWHEAAYLKLDCSKAANKLKWRPRWSLEQALEYTVTWYQAYYSKQSIEKLTLQQINSYINSYSKERSLTC